VLLGILGGLIGLGLVAVILWKVRNIKLSHVELRRKILLNGKLA